MEHEYLATDSSPIKAAKAGFIMHRTGAGYTTRFRQPRAATLISRRPESAQRDASLKHTLFVFYFKHRDKSIFFCCI